MALYGYAASPRGSESTSSAPKEEVAAAREPPRSGCPIDRGRRGVGTPEEQRVRSGHVCRQHAHSVRRQRGAAGSRHRLGREPRRANATPTCAPSIRTGCTRRSPARSASTSATRVEIRTATLDEPDHGLDGERPRDDRRADLVGPPLPRRRRRPTSRRRSSSVCSTGWASSSSTPGTCRSRSRA